MVDAKQFSDAVWAGDLATVDSMIADGANVDVADAPRDRPLHLAIEQRWIEIVRRLVEAGASINTNSEDGWTPLVHAIDIESDAAWQSHYERGHESTELTKLLLEAGAIPTEHAIKTAQDYNNYKAMELLGQYLSNSRIIPST